MLIIACFFGFVKRFFKVLSENPTALGSADPLTNSLILTYLIIADGGGVVNGFGKNFLSFFCKKCLTKYLKVWYNRKLAPRPAEGARSRGKHKKSPEALQKPRG